jgi:hypothetical protein
MKILDKKKRNLKGIKLESIYLNLQEVENFKFKFSPFLEWKLGLILIRIYFKCEYFYIFLQSWGLSSGKLKSNQLDCDGNLHKMGLFGWNLQGFLSH